MSQNPFRIPNPDEVRSEIFPSLLVRQCITLRPNLSQGREIPYDTYCPSTVLLKIKSPEGRAQFMDFILPQRFP